MIGALVGDIVGSIYEFNNLKTKSFLLFSPNCFFTDDTVMTIAVAKALIDCKGNYANLESLTIKNLQFFGSKYPNLSYGLMFKHWLSEKNPKPYYSFGNGAAMRISPVAYFAKSEQELKEISYKVTKVTHNHPEGLKGAEATAIAVWLALHKESKEEIKHYIEKYYYSLDFNYNNLIETYEFNESCQKTVPQAIYCFLISKSFEDAIRIGVSIGGDTDTICAIIGGIAEAYYGGVPKDIACQALNFLDKYLLKVYKKIQKRINYN